MVLANSLLHATSKFKKLLPYLTFFIVTKVKKVILINDNTLTFEVVQYSEIKIPVHDLDLWIKCWALFCQKYFVDLIQMHRSQHSYFSYKFCRNPIELL